MDSRNNKEKWVNEVLASTEGMKKAEANPFLYEKIRYRMQQKGAVQDIPAIVLLSKWIIACLVILAINSIAITTEIRREKDKALMQKDANVGMLGELGNQTTYNY